MAIRTIPSLVIGLGGTGKRALTHLKRRIYDTYGRADLPWIRLLSIDTDSAGVNNPPVISQRTGEFISLGTNELRVIDQSDTPQIISNLDSPENRHIKDWYPDPDMRVDFPKAARGSGQVRMFGKIGLYKGENLHTTYRWLQQAAHEVSDPAAWEDFTGFEVDPTLQFVYIICSICGGTGSGMFLDVAYMLRKIVGVDPSTRRFIGMLVMPEVYEPVVENQHIRRIYSNGYAALRELDYLLNSPKRSYIIKGKDHTFADFPRDVTPFDFTFLFSNKNKRGAVISQRQVSGDKPVAADDRVSQYMSETIMTDVLSPLTERSESILSNIFTSIAEPETMGDRTFYKAYSAVGVSSVKVPPIAYFQDMLEVKMSEAVIDFLLRPDPDITEKALAKQFFADNLSKIEDTLTLKASLSTDASYGRYLSRAFFDEFKQNRPACINKLKQWSDTITSDTVDPENPLEIEKQAANASKQAIANVATTLDTGLKSYVKDPERGYVFLREYLEELIALGQQKLAQLPPAAVQEGDTKRPVKEATDSLQRVANDVQLPVLRDTVEVLLERLANYYDNFGREGRSRSMLVNFYNDLIKMFESVHANIKGLSETVSASNKDGQQKLSARIASMGDTSQERVLIDKSLIGRKEVERFLDGLLAPLWEKSDWKCASPVLSTEMKQLITIELAPKLFAVQLDKSLDADAKKQKLEDTLKGFVKEKLFDKLFPTDSQSGMVKEPSYTNSDGRSMLLDFANDNLLPLMIAHSSPLWSVQTHQLGSASAPVTFVGLNGIKIPEKVVEDLQEQIPNFRTTDIVLSDVEPRVVVKQYDPLYSLASMNGIADYENYYKNTDRKLNPMHTDVKFTIEPNPYLQWLSYVVPEDEPMKVCPVGHDITAALADGAKFCPTCSKSGAKVLMVPGKMLCPKCQQIIDEGSRKCPECASLIIEDKKAQEKTWPLPRETKKELCPGCVTLHRDHPETMTLKTGADAGGAKSYCPSCGSIWANLCPYCSAPLEKPTLCTKGSDRCIFEGPPIVLCASCSCPVTPDTTKCPRCFHDLVECEECRKEGKEKRMITKGTECPEKHVKKAAESEAVTASAPVV
ncbi:MAG TPA: tubulin-like doman-containing protein [Drouetiella sp.]